jgi:NAD(P)-dependent dehydrogenase (short-subunit alcohol dehydrogenase family)
MASLTGKTALVTGATGGGIGFGIARHFLSLGASVVIHGRDQAQATRAASELSPDSVACTGVSADLRDVAACRAMMQEAIGWKSGLDVLVNNAGMVDRGYLENAPVELWDDIMAVNLRAPFICLQEAVASMKTRGGGSIVNIGSVNAYIGAPKLGPYSVSKGGLMTLTRNAASALHRYKIRVNQLNVGWTLTENEDVVQKREGTRTDWLRDAIAIMPFGRLLTPHEIALAAAYFASDDSALITGAVLDMEQYPLGAPADW